MGIGLILMRKPGKLPHTSVSLEYDLEYGTDSLHMHEDAVKTGDRVVVLDDLLATGGTMGAACALIRAQGATVIEAGVIVELAFLGGRERLDGVPAAAMVNFA